MVQFLAAIGRNLWPDLDQLTDPDRLALLRELLGVLFGLPFVLLAAGWLWMSTNWLLVQQQWPILLLLLFLSFIAGRITFFQISISRSGKYDYNGSSLEIVIVFSAMFIFGPTAVWIPFIGRLINFAVSQPKFPSRFHRINRARNLLFNLGAGILGLLLALLIYQRLGGQYPLSSLEPSQSWPAFAAVLLWLPWESFFFLSYLYLPKFLKLVPPSIAGAEGKISKRMFLFFLVANTPAFFGILAAVIFNPRSIIAYLFLIGGILLASLLARRLSQQAVMSQEYSREVTLLEQLGRAIIAAPADASTLPDLLEQYVPRMFGYHQMEIRLYDNRTLLKLPRHRTPIDQRFWDWAQDNPQSHYLGPGETVPWTGARARHLVYITPILSSEGADPLGIIYLAFDRLYFEDTIIDMQPALQVLAAQIATALQRAKVHLQNIKHQKTVQELAFAWQIQASFLPRNLPQIEGWGLSAALKPCKETSGDFYDVIPLPNGQYGLLIADVADKGMGAALYMALSRTLIRTFAFEHPTRPDLVLQAANQRILSDTQNEMFVTVFFAVLEPEQATLTYANAGHNPAYLFKAVEANEGKWPLELHNTGMPLGILPEAQWQTRSLTLAPGEVLVLYTDGVTDAQDHQGRFFGEERLVTVVQGKLTCSAAGIEQALESAVENFSAKNAPCDDVTLVILKRD